MSDNIFVPPPYENQRPLSWYDEAAKQPGFIADAAQKIAIGHLDTLWEELVNFKQKRQGFLGKSLRAPQVPRGLYFYGGVGRGKSFLMDTFFACLPFKRKKRYHFHAFMADIHKRMGELKKADNPLFAVADEIAQEARVLCFDEFHVSDIADAMILGRLLEGLFAKGVVLVATSNYKPDDLYPQGQNRSSFLPTIKLINEKLTVLNIDGGEDYRLRTLKQADIFYIPNNAENEQKLQQLFDELVQHHEQFTDDIEILGRNLPVKVRTENIIWFDFRTLCFTARSQQDYLFLAENYQFVFISGIEKLTEIEKSEARRLTWLIDVFYDYRVKLCATSAVSVNEIYTEGDFAEEFTRTASRMTEMQSESYLSQKHLLDQSAHD